MSASCEFDARKAGQVAAFFVLRQGGLLNVVKLIKLVYLANREFMRTYDEPLFMDAFVSMRHGPVNIGTYETMNSGGDGWDEFISDRENHNVALASPDLNVESFDELSEADLETLTAIWERFGGMNEWQLVKYTHENCPEWEDPGSSISAIPYSRIFKFLHKSDPEKLEQRIIEQKQLEGIFANLR